MGELRLLAAWELLYIYRARLRARLVLVQELLAVLGLAVGVALLFASQVASTSLAGSIQQLTAGVVGRASVQLVARAPDGFDERLLRQVRRLPGVQAAEPVLEQRATVLGPLGQRSVDLLAGEPRYVHLGGGLLTHFTLAQLAALRMIALPVPLARAIGVDSLQTVTLELGASRLTVLMGATLDAGDVGALVNSPVALAPLAYAQALTGLRGRVTRILVLTRPGRAREVRRELAAPAAVAQANLEPADHDAQLFDTAAAPADQSEELFSAISALVGFLFAFNALLVTVHLRRSLVALLRRQGATRPMLVQVLLFDALVLGVLGSLLGLALGEVLSIAVFRANPGYLSFAFAVGAQRLVTWQSVALAVGTGLAAASIGVLAPLYGVLRARLRTAPARAGVAQMRVALRAALAAWRSRRRSCSCARSRRSSAPSRSWRPCCSCCRSASTRSSLASSDSSARSTRRQPASRSSNWAPPPTARARWRSPPQERWRCSAPWQSRARGSTCSAAWTRRCGTSVRTRRSG